MALQKMEQLKSDSQSTFSTLQAVKVDFDVGNGASEETRTAGRKLNTGLCWYIAVIGLHTTK